MTVARPQERCKEGYRTGPPSPLGVGGAVHSDRTAPAPRPWSPVGGAPNRSCGRALLHPAWRNVRAIHTVCPRGTRPRRAILGTARFRPRSDPALALVMDQTESMLAEEPRPRRRRNRHYQTHPPPRPGVSSEYLRGPIVPGDTRKWSA
jgi:hypothetical protein